MHKGRTTDLVADEKKAGGYEWDNNKNEQACTAFEAVDNNWAEELQALHMDYWITDSKT